MKFWMITCILLLLAAGAFVLPSMRGYLYISALLILAAVTIAVVHLAPETAKKIYFILLSVGLIYFLALELLVVSDARTDADSGRGYVVVLGAGVKGETPTLSLQHRIEAAEDYLRRFPDAKAVLSGGKGAGEDISEAECMKRELVRNGIEPERLILEDRSTSTKENLQFSKELIQSDGGSMDDVAIVSSPYHLHRAKVMARSLGYEDPAGVACVHGYPLYSLGMYIREAFGLTHMMVFGD